MTTLTFGDFRVLRYREEAPPIFAFRFKPEVPVREVAFTRHTEDLHWQLTQLNDLDTVVIPLLVNAKKPKGDDWKGFEYMFGTTKIAGYYR